MVFVPDSGMLGTRMTYSGKFTNSYGLDATADSPKMYLNFGYEFTKLTVHVQLISNQNFLSSDV